MGLYVRSSYTYVGLFDFLPKLYMRSETTDPKITTNETAGMPTDFNKSTNKKLIVSKKVRLWCNFPSKGNCKFT